MKKNMSIRNRGLVRPATEKSGVEYRPIFISVLPWQSEYPAYWKLLLPVAGWRMEWRGV